MKITVLDGHALNPGDVSWDFLRKYGEVTIYDRTPDDLIVERIGQSQMVFLNKVVITEKIFEQCPSLKYIGVLATGYNVVDVIAAKKHNVIVTNIPSYSTDAVAQHVFSFILHFTNQVALHNESVKKGEWVSCPDFCYWLSPLTELKGKTLGIFGYGSIGSKVAEIAKAFGLNVICHTRTQKQNMPPMVSFEQLLKESDFISLHAPLTEKTKDIINKESLSLMKKTAYLINTARGGFIVENDLKEALNNDKIAGYAADVVLTEPMDKTSPLLEAKNCIITPHIAWAPLETRQRLLRIAQENIEAFLSGKPINVVS